MDRIRAERRLEEKARVAAQNAEVRAKKDAAKAKSDAVSLFFVGIYTGNQSVDVFVFFLLTDRRSKRSKGSGV